MVLYIQEHNGGVIYDYIGRELGREGAEGGRASKCNCNVTWQYVLHMHQPSFSGHQKWPSQIHLNSPWYLKLTWSGVIFKSNQSHLKVTLPWWQHYRKGAAGKTVVGDPRNPWLTLTLGSKTRAHAELTHQVTLWHCARVQHSCANAVWGCGTTVAVSRMTMSSQPPLVGNR